jgi:peptide deformylase
MTLRQIITLPAPTLRRKARRITKFDKDLQTLIDDMIETMRAAPGVGLAAPQVDASQQLFVVEYAEEQEEDPAAQPEAEPNPPAIHAAGTAAREARMKKLFIVINPEITKASEEKVNGIEGCLSIPGLQGEVERHEAIEVRGLNRFGKPMKIKVDGWMARIFQHEIDHLNGVLFTDRATTVWKLADPEAAEQV